MPVSHLGLTVSHIPSATSFYLAALQPLGYQYIGQQGNSIGLGIYEADFFLSQAPQGTRPAPTHIAFAADNRLQVRDCYAGAINASGRPSGAPSYRNNDCSCFNAAVEDLDGNTIEFIFREGGICDEDRTVVAPSEHSRVLTWQNNVAHEANDGIKPQTSFDSTVSTAKSRARTALDLASTTSKSMITPAEASMTEIPRNAPEKSNGISTQAIVGTVLGAAAGAAIAYAMRSSERDSAHKEAAFEASIASRESDHARSTRTATRAPATRRSASAAPTRTLHRNLSPTESIPPPPRTHRNFSVTDSRFTARPPPTVPPTLPPTTVKAIEPAGYDDSEVQAAISRHTSRRPGTSRSKTMDVIEYAPASAAGQSKYTAKRSATYDEPSDDREHREQLMLEAPMSTMSQYFGRRDSKVEDSGLRRHDSGVSMHSQRSSRHSKKDDGDRRSSASQASTIKPSRRESSVAPSKYEESRHEGSRHESRRDGDSGSQASTIKAPPRAMSRYESAAGVPLPSSRAESHYSENRSRARSSSRAPSRRESSRAPSRAPSRVTGADVRLPDSKVASYISVPEKSRAGSIAPSQQPPVHYAHPVSKSESQTPRSAAGVPLPDSLAVDDQRDDAGDDSDGMGDIKTVVPDDSISCFDYAKARAPASDVSRQSGRSHRSHHTSRSKHSRHPDDEQDRRSHVTSRSKHSKFPEQQPEEQQEKRSYITGFSERSQRPEDEDTGRLDDVRTVLPEDSISSVGLSRPQPAGSEHSRHSERSHKSHHTSRSKHSRVPEEDPDKRSHHTSASKHGRRPEEDDDKRSHHTSVSKRSQRPHEDDDKRSHHTSRSKHSRAPEDDLDKRSHHTSASKHSRRPEEDDDKRSNHTSRSKHNRAPEDSDDKRSHHTSASKRSQRAQEDEDKRSHHTSASKFLQNLVAEPQELDDFATVLPSDSISAAGVKLPDPSGQSAYSRRSSHSQRTFHTSRSKHTAPAPEPAPEAPEHGDPPSTIDTAPVAPDDSISAAGVKLPEPSGNSAYSRRSHHSSRSKTSRREEREESDGKARSEAAKSTSTVKPVKRRRDSVATLPARLRGTEKEGKSGRKSNVSYAG